MSAVEHSHIYFNSRQSCAIEYAKNTHHKHLITMSCISLCFCPMHLHPIRWGKSSQVFSEQPLWPPKELSPVQTCSWRTKRTQTVSQCALSEQVLDTSRFWGMSFLLRTLRKSTFCWAFFSSSTVFLFHVRFSIMWTFINNRSLMPSLYSSLLKGYGLDVIFLSELRPPDLVSSGSGLVQPMSWLLWWCIIWEAS